VFKVLKKNLKQLLEFHLSLYDHKDILFSLTVSSVFMNLQALFSVAASQHSSLPLTAGRPAVCPVCATVSLGAAHFNCHFYCSQNSHATNANNEVLLNLRTLKSTIFVQMPLRLCPNHAKNDLRLGGIKYVIVPEED